MTRSSIDDPLVRCKIDGCTETAKTRFGMYGGLCETHRAARLAERQAARNGKAEVEVIATAAHPNLRAQIQTSAGSVPLDYETLVVKTLVEIDDVIIAAERKVGQLLRAEIAARILPRNGETG
jgi:quinolinate synthase